MAWRHYLTRMSRIEWIRLYLCELCWILYWTRTRSMRPTCYLLVLLKYTTNVDIEIMLSSGFDMHKEATVEDKLCRVILECTFWISFMSHKPIDQLIVNWDPPNHTMISSDLGIFIFEIMTTWIFSVTSNFR